MDPLWGLIIVETHRPGFPGCHFDCARPGRFASCPFCVIWASFPLLCFDCFLCYIAVVLEDSICQRARHLLAFDTHIIVRQLHRADFCGLPTPPPAANHATVHSSTRLRTFVTSRGGGLVRSTQSGASATAERVDRYCCHCYLQGGLYHGDGRDPHGIVNISPVQLLQDLRRSQSPRMQVRI